MIKKGTPVEIRFVLNVPCDASSREQLDEWIKFQLHYGACSNDNPLLDHDMSAIGSSVRIDIR